MQPPIITEADIPERLNPTQIEWLGMLCRLPADCDLQLFGDHVRAAVTGYARDKRVLSLQDQQKQIRDIARLIDHCARRVSAFEGLAQAIGSLDPEVRHLWVLRQSAVADRMPSWRIPEPSELRDPATRYRAAQGLKSLITVGGAWIEGRKRQSGHRSRTWQPNFQAPAPVPGRRQARLAAERTLVLKLQLAVHAAGGQPPVTAHHDKPGPFARMVAEVLKLVGAAGAATAQGMAVQLINDVQAERRARLSRPPWPSDLPDEAVNA
jgi:hypothetical protein